MRNELIINRIFECYQNGELDNNDAKEIIEGLSKYLDLKTLTNYSKSEKISYVAARKRKTEKVIIDNQKFIVDND